MTKIMTRCQGHRFVKNNTETLRFRHYLKGLWMKMKYPKFLFEWTVNHQIVVQMVYRPEILNLAYETPMSGHLGVNKFYHKILNHFYWPGLKSDVSQHCKSCHTCQMVGQPNQTIPKAHLQTKKISNDQQPI